MKHSLDICDYLLLTLIFSISILIGVYHGFKEKIFSLFKKKPHSTSSTNQVNDYLQANSSFGFIPITFSLLASFFSATAIIGIPAEIYEFGIQFWLISFSFSLCPLVGAFLFGPLYSRLKLASVFEFLELRFRSASVRYLGTVCYLINTFIGTSIYIYGPAISLRAYSNLSDSWSILVVGSIATFYTALGTYFAFKLKN